MGVVYVLEDPRETEPKKRDRYVGKSTKTSQVRLLQHIAEARLGKRNYRCNWIRKLLSDSVLPSMRVISVAPDDELNDIEKALIKDMREQGYQLVNGTDGGEGILGWKHSPETRRRQSIAAKNRPPISEETREKKRKSMLGKNRLSDAQKKERSDAMMGVNNPMYGMSGELNPMYGRHHSEEAKRRMRETNSGKNNPMYGRTGELHPVYGRHHSEETKNKIRETSSKISTQQLVECIEQGMSNKEIAEQFNMSPKTIWSRRNQLS